MTADCASMKCGRLPAAHERTARATIAAAQVVVFELARKSDIACSGLFLQQHGRVATDDDVDVLERPRGVASVSRKAIPLSEVDGVISGRAILEQRVTFRGLITIAKDESGSARKLLILNGEMSEWLKEHAWKSNPATLTKSL